MLRGDNIICGTSTVGTGTLTLAACPAAVGAIDFYTAFSGMGFGTTHGIPVSYTIIEYADGTFAKPVQTEKGIGTLTLGASIAATSLARTVVQLTQTGLASTPAYNFNAPTAITIGTAGNVLVFIGASALDLPVAPSNIATMQGGDAYGCIGLNIALGNVNFAPVNNEIRYFPVYFPIPVVAAVARAQVTAGGYSGATNNLYVALYAFDPSTGQPGKLLADFGVLGTPNASFGGSKIASAAKASPPFLSPGWYYVAYQAIWTTGGTGTPELGAAEIIFGGAGLLGTNSGASYQFNYFTATGGSAAFADPAAPITGRAVATGTTSVVGPVIGFWGA